MIDVTFSFLRTLVLLVLKAPISVDRLDASSLCGPNHEQQRRIIASKKMFTAEFHVPSLISAIGLVLQQSTRVNLRYCIMGYNDRVATSCRPLDAGRSPDCRM